MPNYINKELILLMLSKLNITDLTGDYEYVPNGLCCKLVQTFT